MGIRRINYVRLIWFNCVVDRCNSSVLTGAEKRALLLDHVLNKWFIDRICLFHRAVYWSKEKRARCLIEIIVGLGACRLNQWCLVIGDRSINWVTYDREDIDQLHWWSPVNKNLREIQQQSNLVDLLQSSTLSNYQPSSARSPLLSSTLHHMWFVLCSCWSDQQLNHYPLDRYKRLFYY